MDGAVKPQHAAHGLSGVVALAGATSVDVAGVAAGAGAAGLLEVADSAGGLCVVAAGEATALAVRGSSVVGAGPDRAAAARGSGFVAARCGVLVAADRGDTLRAAAGGSDGEGAAADRLPRAAPRVGVFCCAAEPAAGPDPLWSESSAAATPAAGVLMRDKPTRTAAAPIRLRGPTTVIA
jgi:hypothetical protein